MYRRAAERLNRAIRQAYAQKCLGKSILGSDFCVEMVVHMSCGRYMCGEETGLLNALEGKRAAPRVKPPFPATVGFLGKPTAINNVETICNIPHIVLKGSEWYLRLSKSADGGTKIFGVSGHVHKSGLFELPLGTTAREVLDGAGGMANGYRFRAALPGGASTAFILEDHLSLAMDFTSLAPAGSRLGTGTMVVLDDRCGGAAGKGRAEAVSVGHPSAPSKTSRASAQRQLEEAALVHMAADAEDSFVPPSALLLNRRYHSDPLRTIWGMLQMVSTLSRAVGFPRTRRSPGKGALRGERLLFLQER